MNEPPSFADLASIEEIENVWIQARDGVRLAGRVWLPKGARVEPVPALLEYIPYLKRDFMRERDEPMHRFFALSGYASVRVDLRGSGDSDGVLDDEYSPVELDDALAILEWIAAQPWCTGDVGMAGISWGGFNALQVAALAPPQLRALPSVANQTPDMGAWWRMPGRERRGGRTDPAASGGRSHAHRARIIAAAAVRAGRTAGAGDRWLRSPAKTSTLRGLRGSSSRHEGGCRRCGRSPPAGGIHPL